MASPTVDVAARRPIKARDSRWAADFTAWLVKRGVTPNAISVASVGFGALAGAAYLAIAWLPHARIQCVLFLVAIVGIQGRLLCNLFDGMVAVEGGKAGKAGPIFNDLPDRIADPIILASAGYAAGMAHGVELGWAAAAMSLLTAYVRVLGHGAGAGIYFIGPMAKQHRMAVMTAASAVSAVLVFWNGHRWTLTAALALIIVGCVITVARRTRRIIRDLEAK